MKLRTGMAIGLAGIGLAGCATNIRTMPTEVLRYHLGAPIARGTVSVVPLAAGPASLEFRSYAAAVEGQLLKQGYSLPAAGMRADYVATVNFTRTSQDGPPTRSPFSIGLGGGSFTGGRGGGVGLGGGLNVPVGGGKPTAIVVSELAVTIKRTADQSPIWEGRAQNAADVRSIDAQPDASAGKLARALFTGFPGESGRTITVK
ncbi:hypothetical protein ASE75_09685 [Sphingomonas sp. Leaf17]|uniref:DUF4136 domain-containing protein n=1 Tax=Sphingomonas sp. Leaf17 TaxID=1735683 RepID=UPI0006F4192B|nr:DUF4136 domain-containing protein [Sphingomonas sp. Leaf17]KQM64254.1 hypothetical protein ASE75_09685 [Sphingomonas sp. Leaf17]